MARRYPPIPAAFDCPGGPVEVQVVESLQHIADEGEHVFACYDLKQREIKVRKDMKRAEQWRSLWHELTHVALADSGLANGLTSELEEAICDATSAMVMRVLYGNTPKEK